MHFTYKITCLYLGLGYKPCLTQNHSGKHCLTQTLLVTLFVHIWYVPICVFVRIYIYIYIYTYNACVWCVCVVSAYSVCVHVNVHTLVHALVCWLFVCGKCGLKWEFDA